MPRIFWNAEFMRKAFVYVACILILTPFSSFSSARQELSFTGYAGNWTGSGTLSHQSGLTERVRCEATYALHGPNTLAQTLACSSDSTSFRLMSTINSRENGLSGDWTETVRNAHGAFTGSMQRSAIVGTVNGPGFSAGIAIAIRGAKQSIEIRSPGSDINLLQMVLTRGRA
jgi:hypothetical protein